MSIDTLYMDDVVSTREMLSSPCLYNSNPLNVRRFEKAIILPFKHVDTINGIGGGILTQDDQHLSILDIGESRYNISVSDVLVTDKRVVYLGLMNHKWGHCITDNIKKLWFLFSSEFSKLNDSYEIVYTYNEGDPINNNFAELLSLLGVDLKRFHAILQPTKFLEVIVPDDSIIYCGSGCELQNCNAYRVWTNPFKDLFERIPKIQSTRTWDKVYVSRRRWDGADFGEDDIERVFKYMGFSIMYPETMTFVEQLSVYQNCKCLASTEGSISHNSLFMKDGTELIIIRKADLMNTYQLMINDMKNMHVTYIDAHLSLYNDLKHPYVGPFFLYINDHLQQWVWDHTKERKYLKSFKFSNFCAYAKHAFMDDMTNKRTANLYFYHKLQKEISEENRHKYYKLANKILPNIFPWKY